MSLEAQVVRSFCWIAGAIFASCFLLPGCTSSTGTTPVAPVRLEETGNLYQRAVEMLSEVERYNHGFKEVVIFPNGQEKWLSKEDHEDPELLAKLLEQTRGRLDKKPVELFNTPDTLNKVHEHLDQWMRQVHLAGDWKTDPLLQKLPADIRSDTVVFRLLNDLDKPYFVSNRVWPLHDAWSLQQVVWLNAISQIARGDSVEELARARSLFAWTIRNIELEPGEPDDYEVRDGTKQWKWPPREPWHALLLGRGQAVHRAWVFALLARQQGLNVVLLSRPAPEQGLGTRLWAAGLLHNQQLYLFEPRLGMPIPATVGWTTDNPGVATLEQVANDDRLLRNLDVDDEHRYPLTSTDLAAGVLAQLEASPVYVARRTEVLESRLAGEQKLVLSVRPSALAEQVLKCGHVAEVSVWAIPYFNLRNVTRLPEHLARELTGSINPFISPEATLWNARVADLKGHYTGFRNANELYLKVRVAPNDPRWQLGTDDSPENRERWSRIQFNLARAREYASYWLGVVALERKLYDAAINHFRERTLGEYPAGVFVPAARFNLGQAYEALGQNEAAVAAYEADTSVGRHGNMLRAKRLRNKSVAP